MSTAEPTFIDGTTPPGGTLSVLTRLFAWVMLAVLAVFLINNVLTHSLGWPGGGAALRGDAPSLLAYLQLLAYPIGIALAFAYVLTTADRSLRVDAKATSNINTFIIRAAFWAVFLVGLADAAISFLRVEGYLAGIVGSELTTQLGRPQFRGAWVHVPLIFIGVAIACVTRTLGFIWLAFLIVIAELAIVFTRFIFSYEQAFMGDLVRFWYAALFLFASAYTLLEDGHVRVDIMYAGFSHRGKGIVNALGSILLGLTLCWTILIIGLGGKAAVINSPVMNYEVSQSGFGMYIKYLMAGFLGLFAVSMQIQFLSYLMDAIADYRDEAGRKPPAAEIVH